jgi:hypothetical protein
LYAVELFWAEYDCRKESEQRRALQRVEMDNNLRSNNIPATLNKFEHEKMIQTPLWPSLGCEFLNARL